MSTGHLCRLCQTELLQQIDAGPSGGGNAYFECPYCRTGVSSLGTHKMCFCGVEDGRGDRPMSCVDLENFDKSRGWSLVSQHGALGVVVRNA